MPLSGVRVLDLTISWSGPYCTRLLATMGAEVIRVDNPHIAPGRPYKMSTYINDHNINKYSVAIDLATPKGVELFKRLVSISDVVAENFSARVMGNLGLDYESLKAVKPDIIMLSMPGFGNSGPYRDYVAYGTVIEAMVGLSQLTGYEDGPPLRVGIAYPDPTAGLVGAFAVLSALHYRARTGKGQQIELSQFESATTLLFEAIMDYTMNRRVPRRQGNRHRSIAPHEVFPCRGDDSWIAIAVTNDEEWRALCDVMGRQDLADDPRFSDILARYEHQDEINAIIAGWTRQFDHNELMQRLQAAGVPAGAVLSSPELLADPHLKARDFMVMIDDPVDGRRPIAGPSARLSRTPAEFKWGAPLLGQDQDYVFGELLGMSQQERERLAEDGVIFKFPPPELEGQIPPAAQRAGAT